MPYQTGRNIGVTFVPETTYGVPPAANTAAKVFRVASGDGSKLMKDAINSNEVRRDLQTTRGRHGQRKASGTYPIDLSLGAADDYIQAAIRGTFDTPLVLTGLSLVASNAAKTITRSSGSWITDGVRAFDVVRFTGFATTTNNNRNFRVVGATALVLTVAEAPTQVTTAETGVSMTRPKKVVPGSVARSFSVEEIEYDIGVSRIFSGTRIGGFQLQLSPNGIITLSFTTVAQDLQTPTAAGAVYTNTTTTTSIGMTAIEAAIRLGTGDIIDVTSLNLNVNNGAAGIETAGGPTTPDVFTNALTMDGNVTALRSDLSRELSFLNETQSSLHLMGVIGTEPKDFCSFVVPNLSLSSADPSGIGGDGPRTQSMGLLIGADDRGGVYDPGMFKFQTSAA